ncbi:MAG: AI-2E family transporter [Planctomycetaceae bacterium]|nr:AI-2E family transporter [Planctomycetaceae bacterium]
MTENSTSPKRITIAGSLMTIAAAVVILAGLKAAQMIVAPFLLAAFFAIVLIPPLRWLKSKGFSDVVAFSVLCASVLIVGILMIGILAKSANMFIAKIPDYQNKVGRTLATIDDVLEPYGLSLHGGVKTKDTKKTLPPFPVEAPKPEMTAEETESEEESPQTATDDSRLNVLRESSPINTVGIITFIQRGVTELCLLIGVAVLVLVMLVFMILEAARMPQKLLDAFGSKGITNDQLKKIAEETWRYVLIKGMISFFTGLFTWIFLWLMGIEYAALWGIMAFFFNFIPNLGPILSSVPPMALALFDHGFGSCAIVTGGLIAINWIGGYYFEPKYLGDGLGISPLVVLLSLIFWGWIFGVIGMFLSAPLTMVVKIVLNSFDDTKWVSRLMDG